MDVSRESKSSPRSKKLLKKMVQMNDFERMSKSRPKGDVLLGDFDFILDVEGTSFHPRTFYAHWERSDGCC